MDTVAGTALDAFVHHRLPWMGKKAVEMGRYYGSEALRNKKLRKNYRLCIGQIESSNTQSWFSSS